MYTVQPEFLYIKMREQGFLEGNKDFAMFPEPYEWMVSQMKKHIVFSNMKNYPIWLWRRKPNRNEKALAPKGKRWVILKLDIAEDEILWSSFDEWHTILNNSPIVYDENEWNDFKRKGFPKEEVIKTWERLFDHQWLANRPSDWIGDYKEHWLQGVTSRITMEQIKKVSRFLGKG
ncbi:DUF3841 domain-containing protein [Cytobacillus sp. FJAT-53684]|uniref:DUF3841 domain-containing protein n=1 Tax=Cytobacillus mangrovibacter TaxID=3299024 RepID=A0ABW6K082_9BACI